MPLLNYTTKIDADKTIGQISKMLAKAGATAIMTNYDDAGNITSLSFKLKFERNSDQQLAFTLPTDWKPVQEVLRKQRVNSNEDQARRVAWRITKDWVEAQLAIIETKMVTTAQVFLPYAVTTEGNTLYEQIANSPGILIGDGR